MGKKYGITVITKCEDYTKAIESVTRFIDKWATESTVLSFENQGKKRLVYPIDDIEYATYGYFEIEFIGQNMPNLLSKYFNTQPSILRYLITSIE